MAGNLESANGYSVVGAVVTPGIRDQKIASQTSVSQPQADEA
jgi:hypothetical protein